MTGLSVAATRYPGETRVVVQDHNDHPVAIHLFRGALTTSEGAIWRGRVIGTVSGAKALLVDIGGKEPGFLPFTALPSGTPQLTEGSYITVMIDRPARVDKGPRLTAKLRLSTPRLIFSPYRKGISTSRRIKAEFAYRLQVWAEKGLQNGEGWVLRGAAMHCDEAVLNAERDALRQAWAKVQQGEARVHCLRLATDPFAEWLADFSTEVGHLSVSGTPLITAAQQIVGKDMVHAVLGDAFADAGGDDVLVEALSSTVSLPSGGQMTIEPTRAFWAVDVDSNGVKGPQAAQVCNDEAMTALAEQLILRNMGGAVVVDVIPEGRGAQTQAASKRLLKRLRKLTQPDERVQIYGATAMGHIELVRARRGVALHEVVHGDTLDVTDGAVETAVLDKLRTAVAAVRSGDQAARTLIVSAAELGWMDCVGQDALKEAETMLGQSLRKELKS